MSQAKNQSHRLEDGDEITADIEINTVSYAQESRARIRVQKQIFEMLHFPSLTHRYESIIEAYPQTFDWVFREPTAGQRSWSNFSDWLKSGDGVYWINGKAGSGKSTLMRHIHNDLTTRRHLESWARRSTAQGCPGAPLCLPSFFFWNSGTRDQKSQGGLLRALMLQILRFCPDLAPVAFPEYWETFYSRLVANIGEPNPRLELCRLKSAFKTLMLQTSIPLKVCLLIDGLDEFEGDHEELAWLVKEITNSHNVKVCLSSRPWVVFQETYCFCPSLRLQDLTFRYIMTYVNGKFSSN